jgi:hypothetical protein
MSQKIALEMGMFQHLLVVTGRAKTSQRGALKTGQWFDVASYTSFDAVSANFS